MELVEISHTFLERFFSGEGFEVSDEDKARFDERKGYFVCMKKRGKLRGCIGYVRGHLPLWEGVIDATQKIAFSDPAHPPLRKEELDAIKIEVYVLGALEKLDVHEHEEFMERIDVGEDGIAIDVDGKTSVLLPDSVKECAAMEDFVDCLGEKAGMQRGEWKQRECVFYKFKTEKFVEK